jgi:hypothetical protein
MSCYFRFDVLPTSRKILNAGEALRARLRYRPLALPNVEHGYMGSFQR